MCGGRKQSSRTSLSMQLSMPSVWAEMIEKSIFFITLFDYPSFLHKEERVAMIDKTCFELVLNVLC